VNEQIAKIQTELVGDVQPAIARAHLVTLTALMGNVNQAHREKDQAYRTILAMAYQAESTANRAKIRAECSKEYWEARAAKDLKDELIELIRSCKTYVRSIDEEMRLSGH
jgi:hypothetical protein